jgi:hypothetical protein
MRFACWLTKVTDDPFGSSIIQRGGEWGRWINIFWDHEVTTRCKHECQGWRKRQCRYPVTISWRVKYTKRQIWPVYKGKEKWTSNWQIQRNLLTRKHARCTEKSQQCPKKKRKSAKVFQSENNKAT